MAARQSITITLDGVSKTFSDSAGQTYAENFTEATGIELLDTPGSLDSSTYSVSASQSGTASLSKKVLKLYGSVNGVSKLFFIDGGV